MAKKNSPQKDSDEAPPNKGASKASVVAKKKAAKKKAAGKAAVASSSSKTMKPFSDLEDKTHEKLHRLELMLGKPVWCLVQSGNNNLNSIDQTAKELLFAARDSPAPFGLERNKKVALLIDSSGGLAGSAFEIATLFQTHCGGFDAVIPRRAKSAATLIALGADNLILGEFGELGPLDAQVFNEEREERTSALDEVQSLERLHAFAMTALDSTMFMLAARTGMKMATLLPMASRIVTEMVQPLFSNVDAIRYTQMSRVLRVGEEYARRLLQARFSKTDATEIARKLVELYPEHRFIIDTKEAKELGLKPAKLNDDLRDLLNSISKDLKGKTAIGRIG